MKGLELPEETPPNPCVHCLPHRRFVREAFAGCAKLSYALLEHGLLVRRPLEAYPRKGLYVRSDDLDRLEVRNCLKREIRSGVYSYLHFGIPCTSWANANRLNRGTGRKHCPDGSADLLEREAHGYFQAQYVAELCLLCHEYNVLFTSESPRTSVLFDCKAMCLLQGKVPCYRVDFHMCAFGLQLPGSGPYEFCQKATSLLANFSEVAELQRRCPGISCKHIHTCMGICKSEWSVYFAC